MSTIYVIADLHFGHEKVAIARKFWSTRQHDDAIVAAWNSVVTKRDVVYVLGDVFRLTSETTCTKHSKSDQR